MVVSCKIVLFLTSHIKNCNIEMNRVFLCLNFLFNEPWIYDIELLNFVCTFLKKFSPGKCFGITFTLFLNNFFDSLHHPVFFFMKVVVHFTLCLSRINLKTFVVSCSKCSTVSCLVVFPRRGKLISFLLNGRKVSKHDVEVVMIIKYMQLF